VFDNVGGLIPGDPVTVNGVKEGKISAIGWQGRKVLCTVEINDHIQLYEDASFSVISAELLAGMKVEIFPGKSDKHINLSKQPFPGSYGGRIVDVGMVIGELAEDVSSLSFRIDTTITMINTLLETGKLQNDLTTSLENINQITTDFKGFPKRMVYSLNQLDTTIANINLLVKNNDRDVTQTLQNLNTISSRLDTVATSMKVVLAKVENREGTLGQMVYDTTLYNHMNKTLLSIDSLARQIQKEGLQLDLF
jgi:phospholipid/cholesterol/gamma-HCH transport system substrate-binding protein